MSNTSRVVIIAVAMCALFGAAHNSATAGTIIKLTLGSVSPDIEYDGSTFSTEDDLNGATTGNQDTDVEFTDFLESEPDIVGPPPASFTLSGLQKDGDASLFNGSLILQNFTGGTLTLYDTDNSILLSGTLADSSLVGNVGQSAGALFTTSFGSVTTTSLPNIDTDTLVLSMSLTGVVSGNVNGFAVSGIAGALPVQTATLANFTADATVNIEAEFIPEPSSLALLAIGVCLAFSRRRT